MLSPGTLIMNKMEIMLKNETFMWGLFATDNAKKTWAFHLMPSYSICTCICVHHYCRILTTDFPGYWSHVHGIPYTGEFETIYICQFTGHYVSILNQLTGLYEFYFLFFWFFSSLPHGVSCLLHHVCMVILANHLHQTNEPTQRGM